MVTEGFTVILKLIGVPAQPFNEGVTTNVATTGSALVLTAVNEGIFPVPLAATPIPEALFVHAKVVPATGLVKAIAATLSPLHLTASATATTVDVGLTVILKVIGVPVQPFSEGVTTIVETIGAVPALIAVNDGMLPVPAEPNPIPVALLVHA
jgi:hypothetical protein